MFIRSWDTIDRAIKSSREELSAKGQRPNRKPTVITHEIESAIEKLLDMEAELQVKKKQRYTAEWIYRKLVEDNIYKGKVRAIRYAVSKIRKRRAQSKK